MKLDLHVHCMKLPHSTASTCMHNLLRIQPCSYQYIVCMVCACTCMQSCIGTVLLHYVHIELYMSYIRDCSSCMYVCYFLFSLLFHVLFTVELSQTPLQ